jgi:hypothetical protein
MHVLSALNSTTLAAEESAAQVCVLQELPTEQGRAHWKIARHPAMSCEHAVSCGQQLSEPASWPAATQAAQAGD